MKWSEGSNLIKNRVDRENYRIGWRGNANKPHSASNRLKFCELCNRVWEIGYQSGNGRRYRKVLYYEDFPTYKLKRVACKHCKHEK